MKRRWLLGLLGLTVAFASVLTAVLATTECSCVSVGPGETVVIEAHGMTWTATCPDAALRCRFGFAKGGMR